jgi:hypothetical protein
MKRLIERNVSPLLILYSFSETFVQWKLLMMKIVDAKTLSGGSLTLLDEDHTNEEQKIESTKHKRRRTIATELSFAFNIMQNRLET